MFPIDPDLSSLFSRYHSVCWALNILLFPRHSQLFLLRCLANQRNSLRVLQSRPKIRAPFLSQNKALFSRVGDQKLKKRLYCLYILSQNKGFFFENLGPKKDPYFGRDCNRYRRFQKWKTNVKNFVFDGFLAVFIFKSSVWRFLDVSLSLKTSPLNSTGFT